MQVVRHTLDLSVLILELLCGLVELLGHQLDLVLALIEISSNGGLTLLGTLVAVLSLLFEEFRLLLEL